MDTAKLLDGRLKLRHFVLIDALSQQGTIVGAATALHVTQPVITRALQDLESILGVQLYERGPRGVTPTTYGVAFASHARAVLAQIAQAGRHLTDLSEAKSGVVDIGTHLAGSSILIPRAIARLKSERPLLTVVVREGSPIQLLADLRAGRLDLIVGRIVSPSDAETTRMPLCSDPFRLAVRANHPLLSAHAIVSNDLAAYPWILPGTDTSLRRELEEYWVRSGFEVPANRVELTSFLTIRQLLNSSDMIAVLPGLIVRHDSSLAELPFDLEEVSHAVGATYSACRTLDPAAAALLAKLREVASEL